ncbi:MAG: transcriptional regulator [Alphaproteobacteria bacterium]|nr:MAG: transcriptional regulator [Alphaproteobacteria bacterium]
MRTSNPTKAIPKRSPEVQAARDTLRRKGWSQDKAAGHLGITRPHLTLVLNGKRISRRVLNAIASMPENPEPA